MTVISSNRINLLKLHKLFSVIAFVLFSLVNITACQTINTTYSKESNRVDDSKKTDSAITKNKTEGLNIPSGKSYSDKPFGRLEGFGKNSFIGQSLQYYHVTNLLDAGRGSLRDAISQGNRHILFEVSGVINLQSELVIRHQNIFIDGFSAPPPGIAIHKQGIIISGNENDSTGDHASNIVIQGLRIINASDDGIRIWMNAHDVAIDHVSVYQSGDGNIDITEGAHDITISWCFIGESASGAALQSYQAYHVSWHHNLFFGASGRNPRVVHGPRVYSKGNPPLAPLADIRQNVLWNYGWGMLFETYPDGRSNGNAVSNLFAHDPAINAPSSYLIIANADVHAAGNMAMMDIRTQKQYLSNQAIHSVNSNSTYTEWPAPKIIEPSSRDQKGRIQSWISVIQQAGVAVHFPDTSVEAKARKWNRLPVLRDFTSVWNDG